MFHTQWFQSAVLIALGLGSCMLWRCGSRGRVVKGVALVVMGAAGLVRWKPEWLALLPLAPAVVGVAIGLLMERDEDKAREVAADHQQSLK